MENLETIINTKNTGGFPPIYICKKDEIKKNINKDEYVERGFENKNIVSSLKDIMTSRRNSDAKDFISL